MHVSYKVPTKKNWQNPCKKCLWPHVCCGCMMCDQQTGELITRTFVGLFDETGPHVKGKDAKKKCNRPAIFHLTPPHKHLRGKSLVPKLLGRSHHEILQARCAISARVAVSLLLAGVSWASYFQSTRQPATKKSPKCFEVPLQLDTTKLNQTCGRTCTKELRWQETKVQFHSK